MAALGRLPDRTARQLARLRPPAAIPAGPGRQEARWQLRAHQAAQAAQRQFQAHYEPPEDPVAPLERLWLRWRLRRPQLRHFLVAAAALQRWCWPRRPRLRHRPATEAAALQRRRWVKLRHHPAVAPPTGPQQRHRRHSLRLSQAPCRRCRRHPRPRRRCRPWRLAVDPAGPADRAARLSQWRLRYRRPLHRPRPAAAVEVPAQRSQLQRRAHPPLRQPAAPAAAPAAPAAPAALARAHRPGLLPDLAAAPAGGRASWALVAEQTSRPLFLRIWSVILFTDLFT